jgi:4-amino-4-deoxy-L-arabinose transferase-like glycosyltransferase
MAEKKTVKEGGAVGVRIRVAFFLLASTIVILIGQAGRELVPPDDLREVEVAREMCVGGDYIVPHLAGLPFVEKPSGFPAVVATVYRIVGRPSAVAARFTAAAFALASLAAVFLLGTRILGIEGGSLAAAILAFSKQFCRTAHWVLLDNALTAAIAFTVLFTWIALEAADVRKKRLVYAAAGFSLGVSFLFKGFVGPAIFGSGFVLYLIVTRRFGELWQIFGTLPVIAFLVPVLGWVFPFLLQASSNLTREFFIVNHFGRFMFAWLSNKRPVYFYFINIWWAFAPGSIFLPLAIWVSWKTRKEWENRAGIFFLTLFIGPLVLLSASSAKDSVYFLPVHPALAMLVAWSIVKGWRLPGRGVRILTWITATAAILAAGSMLGMTGIRGASALSVATASAVFVFAAVGCLLSIRRNDLRWIAACIAVLFALGESLWFTGPMREADVARRSIHRPLVEILSHVGNRDILLYCPAESDGLRGEASFYRNRTAQEITSPATLVTRLIKDQNGVVAFVFGTDKDALPPELNKAAQATGANLWIEAQVHFGRGYLLLVSIGSRTREGTTSSPF